MKGKNEKSGENNHEQKTDTKNAINADEHDKNVANEEIKRCERFSALKAMLLSVDSSKELWPTDALKNILKRFERMPRGGWKMATDVFCNKFNDPITMKVFKKRAHDNLKNELGRSISNKIY
ncbi:hypothetical protein NAPIS_ORF00283 [Vairimorpha apis BRL 01]|uniref:Uncharacterized protein n=1 Tax=Vairimorpha apis BRL 01 TaxID=1037528 RepID=T0MGA2_9MICR|nr:hypothetical protein NAPIS_ORF00283 [Vairimorpha apis BRL 01]